MSQGITLAGRGDPQRAIETVDRAIAILAGHGQFLAYALNDRGEILLRLGRTAEARIAFERSLRTEQGERPLTNALTGLGRVEVTTGNPKAAVPLLERALRIREGHETDRTLVAEAQFALACALWDSRGDRTRALSLAKAARSSYAGGQATRELAEVDAWLATTAVKRAHR
jgi:serine/threonine-protein kinase